MSFPAFRAELAQTAVGLREPGRTVWIEVHPYDEKLVHVWSDEKLVHVWSERISWSGPIQEWRDALTTAMAFASMRQK